MSLISIGEPPVPQLHPFLSHSPSPYCSHCPTFKTLGIHVQPDETPVLKRAELKLSLLAKVSIRDSWEPEAPRLLQKIQEMMGVDYDFDVDWKAFIDSTEPDQKGLRQNPAPIVLGYFTYFVDHLTKLVNEGDDPIAVETFNSLISKKKIRLALDPECDSYSGCSIKDGIWEINYRPGVVDQAIFKTSKSTLPLIARRAIRDQWEKRSGEVTKRIRDQLNGFDVKLVADYEAIWAGIVADPNFDEGRVRQISRGFGDYLYDYFYGFSCRLEDRFHKDELMTETFAEACSQREIAFEIVRDLEKEIPEEGRLSINGCLFEHGRFKLVTTGQHFGYNTHDAGDLVASIL
ncbi:hypothetical protein SISNIDRAFT_484426 [Sistotremastrum niveocremeum HHB9708]|uniref:Uncharacterized protein n=1 Tax=Sistotremastrum niveocremeum HHB9708 TaxID=1314777 RepID=A0A164WBG5_9AGAM|nr:hypothetical protein SISNIDRAFT_484426 [Sistotremastrum niveocremeum HHB9708]